MFSTSQLPITLIPAFKGQVRSVSVTNDDVQFPLYRELSDDDSRVYIFKHMTIPNDRISEVCKNFCASCLQSVKSGVEIIVSDKVCHGKVSRELLQLLTTRIEVLQFEVTPPKSVLDLLLNCKVLHSLQVRELNKDIVKFISKVERGLRVLSFNSVTLGKSLPYSISVNSLHCRYSDLLVCLDNLHIDNLREVCVKGSTQTFSSGIVYPVLSAETLSNIDILSSQLLKGVHTLPSLSTLILNESPDWNRLSMLAAPLLNHLVIEDYCGIHTDLQRIKEFIITRRIERVTLAYDSPFRMLRELQCPLLKHFNAIYSAPELIGDLDLRGCVLLETLEVTFPPTSKYDIFISVELNRE